MKRRNTYLLLLCLLVAACKGDQAFVSNDAGGGSGRGGSLARFTILNNRLYVVNNSSLNTFKLSSGGTMTKESEIALNAFAETIFPFKNHLLLGTRTGMFIYGLDNPDIPNFRSQYQHFASCDPVVAQGNYAYVTLRNGTPCMWGQNQLDVLDISNFDNPILVNSTQMTNPQGLSAVDASLYVCEGENGMTVFDISNPESPQVSKTIPALQSNDIIGSREHLVVTGPNGISQFKRDASGEMQLLSLIAIGE